jgi:hypothetical protein
MLCFLGDWWGNFLSLPGRRPWICDLHVNVAGSVWRGKVFLKQRPLRRRHNLLKIWIAHLWSVYTNSDFQCWMRFSVSDVTKDRINPIFCEVLDATVASDIHSCKQTFYVFRYVFWQTWVCSTFGTENRGFEAPPGCKEACSLQYCRLWLKMLLSLWKINEKM